MTLLTPHDLKIWLEWAGGRLVAMPNRGPRPDGNSRVMWPEYAREAWETDFRDKAPLRAPPPGAEEIPMVDLILSLPNICADVPTRRILHIRALVNPLTGRNLYDWDYIAHLLGVKRRFTVKAMHRRGLNEVAVKAPADKVCRIATFLESRIDSY